MSREATIQKECTIFGRILGAKYGEIEGFGKRLRCKNWKAVEGGARVREPKGGERKWGGDLGKKERESGEGIWKSRREKMELQGVC